MSGKQARPPLLTLIRACLLLWAAGGLLWIGYWGWYFHEYCDFAEVSSCVGAQGQWAATYSVKEIFALVFGVPALLLPIALAIGWGRTRHAPRLTESTESRSSPAAPLARE
jgi:hypothetical protein